MLDRLARRSQESEVHPHEWNIRHSSLKRLRSRTSDDFPSIPSPFIFNDVAIPYSLTQRSTAPPTFEQYPAPGHVASHLLLIECFSKLMHDVKAATVLNLKLQGRDNRLGINLSPGKSSTWTSYLRLAIDRFRLWITRIESVIRHSAVFNRYGTGSHLHGAFTENYLPPIDVLFVWYSYLQNPAAYERLIASNDFRLLSQICFPWDVLPTAIDQNTLEYHTTPAARALWLNLVDIPFDLGNCIEQDLDNGNVAFMSAPAELLDLTFRQSELVGKLQSYQWLRSPSLHGTIQRAMSKYSEEMMSCPAIDVENTQQIPMESLEARSIHDLDLGLPEQLILHTHRTYHSAWQIFAQINNLGNDETLPPPPYDESNMDPTTIDTIHENGHVAPDSCHCWICERIKDETGPSARARGGVTATPNGAPPQTPLSQDGERNEKLTLTSSSSSESEDVPLPLVSLDLTKKQIRAIKTDVAVFRYTESLRVKRMTSSSICHEKRL